MLAQRYQKKMLKCNKITISLQKDYNYNEIDGYYLSFLFVCTVSLTLVSDPTSRRFIRWLLFQMFIYIYIYRYKYKTGLYLTIVIIWVYIQDWSLADNCIYVGINSRRVYN